MQIITYLGIFLIISIVVGIYGNISEMEKSAKRARYLLIYWTVVPLAVVALYFSFPNWFNLPAILVGVLCATPFLAFHYIDKNFRTINQRLDEIKRQL